MHTSHLQIAQKVNEYVLVSVENEKISTKKFMFALSGLFYFPLLSQKISSKNFLFFDLSLAFFESLDTPFLSCYSKEQKENKKCPKANKEL